MTTLTLPQLTQPATAASWNDFLLSTASKFGLSSSDWEPGSPTRTIFAVVANALMIEDVDASLIAQAGFLDYAASGSVTYVDTDGNTQTVLVTPDPSILAQNATGRLGALDVLADAVYDVQRVMATKAGGQLAIINTGASTYTFASGAYHVAQPAVSSTPTYANVAALSIAPSAVLGTVSAVAAGGGGEILITTGTAPATGTVVGIAGVAGVGQLSGTTAWKITNVNATQFTLDGSTFSGAWTGGGTIYAPTLGTFAADVAGTASDAAPRTVTQAVTSLVSVAISNYAAWLGQDTESNQSLAARCRLKLGALSPNGPSAAYKFFALTAQTYAPLLTPPLVDRPAQAVTRVLSIADTLTGVVTTTIANSTGGPAGADYPNGGVDDGNDVWAVGAVIQAYAVPLAVTSHVQAASNVSVDVGGSVWVPLANVAAAQSVIAVSASAYLRSLPIAGVTDTGGASNVVPIGGLEAAVSAALVAAQIPVQDIALTLNGSAANVALALSPIPEVATVGTIATNIAVGV